MNLRRVALISGFAFGCFGAPLSAPAQQSGKVPRVGVLFQVARGQAPQVQALFKGLRELGYLEGQNILIEWRSAEGRFERLPDLAAELVRLNVDVIVAPFPQAVQAARRATTAIPIVVVVVGDPVGTGLVASLARPGGNITGLTLMSTDLGQKRLELLKEAVPTLSRVAVLWNPSVPDKVIEWEETQVAARVLGLKLQSLEVRRPEDFESAFAAATRGRADALVTLPEPLMFNNRTRILEFATKNRMPTIFAWREFVEAGALMAYGPSISNNYYRAATYVDKVLKGAKPADLPVEQPMRFELVINMKTAKALGITFPPSIMVRADQVIE